MQKQTLYPVSPRREDHLMERGKSLGLVRLPTPSLKRERAWLPKLKASEMREKQNRNAKSGKSKKRMRKAKSEMRNGNWKKRNPKWEKSEMRNAKWKKNEMRNGKKAKCEMRNGKKKKMRNGKKAKCLMRNGQKSGSEMKKSKYFAPKMGQFLIA